MCTTITQCYAVNVGGARATKDGFRRAGRHVADGAFPDKRNHDDRRVILSSHKKKRSYFSHHPHYWYLEQRGFSLCTSPASSCFCRAGSRLIAQHAEFTFVCLRSRTNLPAPWGKSVKPADPGVVACAVWVVSHRATSRSPPNDRNETTFE